MAAITDETVLAYSAARDLNALYAAYRAASRAHLLVLSRLEEGAEREADDDERLAVQRHIARRAGLARETERVFAIRSAQMRRRMLELRGLAEPE
jgi:hypothetical protein